MKSLPSFILPESVPAACPVPPVSWLSTKVTARWGHQPIRPGGLPSLSLNRQSSFLATASCSTALVAKSNAAVEPFARSSQSHML